MKEDDFMLKIIFMTLLLCFSLINYDFSYVNAAENKNVQYSATTILNTKIFSNDEFGITLEIPEEFEKVKRDLKEGELLLAKSNFDASLLSIDAFKMNGLYYVFDNEEGENQKKEDILKQFSDLAKKERVNKDEKILENSIININDQKVFHFVYAKKVPYKNKFITYISDSYTILENDNMYKISYLIPEIFYRQKYRENLPKIMQSLKFYTAWRTVKIGDSEYTYKIPKSFIDVNPKTIAPDHIFLSGGNIFMTGVILEKLGDNPKHSYYPNSLTNLNSEEKQIILENLMLESKDISKYAKNVKISFIEVNKMDSVLLEFDDSTSHSLSYIFIKDGNYIAFDYIYNAASEKEVRPLVEKSVRSIKL